MLEGGLLGWSTNALVKLDDEVQGIIARTLTAAPARRQAIFAALAAHEIKAGVFDTGEELLPMSFAEVIRHGRVADILRMAFNDVPEGYPGLLERIGERPLDRPGDYLAIHQMLARNDLRAADALRGSGRITRRKLEVLSALDPRWHHASTLERIDTGAEAITFNAAVEFVQSVCSRATDEAVAQAIAQMRPTSTLPRLLDRFVRRADRLPPHSAENNRGITAVANAEGRDRQIHERTVRRGDGWMQFLPPIFKPAPLPDQIDHAVVEGRRLHPSKHCLRRSINDWHTLGSQFLVDGKHLGF